MTRPFRRTALALLPVLAAAACTAEPRTVPTTQAPASPAGAVLSDVTVAFVEDLSPDGASQRVAPAFQGARLAVDAASTRDPYAAAVDLVPFDTGGTAAGLQQVADAIADDPSVVAAIVGPQVTGQVTLGDRLDGAGVPTISLSTLGPDLPARGWSWWRRAVPDVGRTARALIEAVASFDGPRWSCLLGDGSPAASALIHASAAALEARPALRIALSDTDPDDPEVVSAIRDAGCRSVVWGGTPAGGALLKLALVEAGMRSLRVFGGESLKDASFITTAGPRGRGTVAVCPCVDLSTSTDPRAQRFIQDYQSAFGVPPGPFAAEAWDVARMILDALSSGARTRDGVAGELFSTASFDGLARRYAFRSNGTLRDEAAAVRVYRDEGVRWVPVPGTPA
jgi:branched-chain amino acid transport system substrate-binding protein